MSCLLGIAAFLSAPAINIYFITQDNQQSIYWINIVLYAINIFVAAAWIHSTADIFRVFGIMNIFSQVALMSKVWSDEYSYMSQRRDILFLIYILSLLFHFIGFVLINPKQLQKNKTTPKEEEAAAPLKKSLLQKTQEMA